ncbi:hypothetical protein AB0G04_28825 [Actinoplanes sp. NPDC023801]|uniref:hypothetical protein n=1 Tax=Actinoplanes sp. NPDC023801 TaxID=3154595 RepID=UPI00340C9C5B
MTYLDQRDNNALIKERHERRYADRVVWWEKASQRADTRQTELQVFVQNRATAPVQKVYINFRLHAGMDYGERIGKYLTDAGAAYDDNFDGTLHSVFTLDSLAPCTSIKVVTPTVAGVNVLVDNVEFQDVTGRWWIGSRAVGLDGPNTLGQTVRRIDATAINVLVKVAEEKTIEDCTDA